MRKKQEEGGTDRADLSGLAFTTRTAREAGSEEAGRRCCLSVPAAPPVEAMPGREFFAAEPDGGVKA